MLTGVTTWKLSQNGSAPKLDEIDLTPPPVSLNSASRMLPDGVYTTFRTYLGGKIQPINDHIKRLEESARLLGQPIDLDQEEILAALRRIYHASQERDVRIRITVDLSEVPGTVYLSLEALQLPSEDDYSQGVRVATCSHHRENPRAKRTSFIKVGETLRSKLPPGINECLMVDKDGFILEGLTSNFFAWYQGALWTPGSGVLSGITRAQVLEAAHGLELPVRLECLQLSVASEFEEAFLTSSSRLILPIRQIDKVTIGPPGPITRRLSQAIWEQILKSLIDL